MRNRIDTYKSELLLAFAALLCLLSVRFAFYPTWQAMQLHQQLKNQLSQATDLSFPPDLLQRKKHNLLKILRMYQTDTTSYREAVVTTVSTLAERENVNVINIPIKQVDSYHEVVPYRLQQVGLEGSFVGLTRCLNALQAESHIGILRSASYVLNSKYAGSTKKGQLHLDIYLIALH